METSLLIVPTGTTLESQCHRTFDREHGRSTLCSENVQLHGPLQEEGVASRLRDVQVHGTRWRGEHHAHPGTGAVCMCMPFYLASFVRQVNSEENSNKPSLKCHEESCGCAVLTQSSQCHANQHAGWHLRQSATNVARSKKRDSSGGQNIASMFKKSRPSTPCPTPITAATASAPPGRISIPACQPVACSTSQVPDAEDAQMFYDIGETDAGLAYLVHLQEPICVDCAADAQLVCITCDKYFCTVECAHSHIVCDGSTIDVVERHKLRQYLALSTSTEHTAAQPMELVVTMASGRGSCRGICSVSFPEPFETNYPWGMHTAAKLDWVVATTGMTRHYHHST